MNDPLTCRHANEVPPICLCGEDCSCRTSGSCKPPKMSTQELPRISKVTLRHCEDVQVLSDAYTILRVARARFMLDMRYARPPSLSTALHVVISNLRGFDDALVRRSADEAFLALTEYRTHIREDAEALVRRMDEGETPNERLYRLDHAAFRTREDGEREAKLSKVETMFKDPSSVWSPDGELLEVD